MLGGRGSEADKTQSKSSEATRLKKTGISPGQGQRCREASVNELKDTGFGHLLMRAVDTIIKGWTVLSAEMGWGGVQLAMGTWRFSNGKLQV